MKLSSKLYILFALILSGLFGLNSCSRFEYSPYQVLEQTYQDINANNIAALVDNGTDTIRVAVIGDSQRFFESTEVILENINELPDVDFVIHTGDIVDFGIQREYDWMHELISEELEIPYVAVVGNHDLIANGDEIYKAMYGPLDFSFVYMGTKFIYINTNSREFDFDNGIPNLDWLAQELADTAAYDQAVAVMHVPPHHSDFNPYIRRPFEETLSEDNRTLICINGHDHNFRFHTSPIGLPYLNSYSTTKEQFVLLKIWSGGFSFESY